MTTPTLLEAARAALDALERYQVKRQDFDRFAEEIADLRAAIEAAEKAEPMFLLHTGAMYGNERDEYEIEADSGERVDRFCDQHPGQTFPLYLHPPAQPMTWAEMNAVLSDAQIKYCLDKFPSVEVALIRLTERHHKIGARMT